VSSTAQAASWRLLAPFVVLAVIAGALFSARAVTMAPEAKTTDKSQVIAARDYYYTLAPPRVDFEAGQRDVAVAKGSTGVKAYGPMSNLQTWWSQQQRKHNQGFPRAAAGLAKAEAKAVATGENPRKFKKAPATQEARLLTVLVEFNPEAEDDFSGFNRIIDINSTPGEDCVVEPAGTFLSGPLHNNLEDPATVGIGSDNNTFWVEDFNTDHYDSLLYSTEGITERVRPDLMGPDGAPGIDISGFTMKNMYLEMSKGAYDITGDTIGWIELPHSEAYYGADTCAAGRASDVGHPDNVRGAAQMVVDAVDIIAANNPDFPWETYDVEDQGDIDGDGNFFEPDGVIDHFVIVHAGAGEEGGGGEQGVYAVWSHSSAVDIAAGGYDIPGAGLKVFNYIAQPEDAGVGVFAHEYGHDLGLPDLYDVIGQQGTSIEFWDLMNTGSHSGPIFQSMPAHMGLWDKFVLGWANPEILNPGDDPRMVQLGQTSRTPVGTKDGIRVNLPNKTINLAEAHSGSSMWWSNSDQNWADVKITRTLDVPADGDVRFWMWNNYVIEFDQAGVWDAGFVEVSTDGGSTWAQLVVHDETGAVVTTNLDGNGRLHDYGDLENALSGSSDGWRHDYVDLTPYYDQSIQLRLRYATDAGFLERGWFADDFELTQDGTPLWSDDVEGGANGWTATTGSFDGGSGAGWVTSSGQFSFAQYYLAEWRNLDGFDQGLAYTYDSDYLRFDNGEWSVQRVPYNAPGMLVWYRDIQYGNFNQTTANLTALPSGGAKGGLLIVDSHFDPLRRTGEAAAHDGSALKNIQSRPQAANAAFGVKPTFGFTECLEDPVDSYQLFCTEFDPQAPVKSFTDALGWAPGIEYRPDIDPAAPFFFRDADASVVIPSAGNQPYSTRIVDAAGNLIEAFFGGNFGFTLAGTGNPSDGIDVTDPEDVSMGVIFEVSKVGKGNTFARIFVDPGNH
jgi:immune inhibitor A